MGLEELAIIVGVPLALVVALAVRLISLYCSRESAL